MRKNAIRFMLNDYPDVMSIDEMCRALSIGKKTGYKLLQTGQIRFLKIGRAYRIPKINLLEYLQVMLMYGKVSQENYVELTAASAIPNKEIKSPQILRY